MRWFAILVLIVFPVINGLVLVESHADPGTVSVMQSSFLKAPFTDARDGYGRVAMDGNTLVVGAPFDDSAASGIDGDAEDNNLVDAGAVHVYVRAGNGWQYQAYLKASNPDPNDFFGGAVAISGNTLVVGAGGEDSAATGVGGDQSDNSATASGAVYVFVREGTSWSQQAYLKPSPTIVSDSSPAPDINTTVNDFFGQSVAICGDTLVVGSHDTSAAFGIDGTAVGQFGDLEFNHGAAYVFERTGSSWSQQAFIKDEEGEYYGISGLADFGRAVAISGDRMAISKPGEFAGKVLTYERAGAVWTPTEEFSGKGSVLDQVGRFGESVAMDGDTLVVGAPGTPHVGGEVTVYTLEASAWSFQSTITKPTPSGSFEEDFGSTVSVSGDLLVVGATGESSNATGVNGNEGDTSLRRSGAAYIFAREGGTWNKQAYLKASNTGEGDHFGHRVSASGRTAVVGTGFEDSDGTDEANDDATNSGAVYVFDLISDGRLYVNAASAEGGDGSSWENAFRSLQDALAAAALRPFEIQQIWVAAGVYFPDDGESQLAGSREASFSPGPDLEIYGGFGGNEIEFSERDPAINLTILSGDIDGNDADPDSDSIAKEFSDIVGGNSFHVVDASQGNQFTLLDGLVITAGSASGGTTTEQLAGGIYIDGGALWLRNCQLLGNEATTDGGAMRIIHANVRAENSVFSGNRAADDGGAIYSAFSDLSLTGCRVLGNTALDRAGGIYCVTATGVLTDCVVAGNSAANEGGGLHIKHAATFTATGTTISGNYAATSGGGIFSETVPTLENDIRLYNTVIWNNATASGTNTNSSSINFYDEGVVQNFTEIAHSLVENETVIAFGAGNLDGTQASYDPQFLVPIVPSPSPATDGDFRVAFGSPLVDSGGEQFVQTEFDLAGGLRVLDGNGDGSVVVDIGAHERAASFIDLFPGSDPTGDDNDNGVANLVEYSIGSHLRFPEPSVVDGEFRLAIVRRVGAPDVAQTLEFSTYLSSDWQTLAEGEDYTVVEAMDLADGFERVILQIELGQRGFFRQRIEYLP